MVELKVNPGGSPVTVNVVAVVDEAIIVYVNGCPSVAVAVRDDVICGAGQESPGSSYSYITTLWVVVVEVRAIWPSDIVLEAYSEKSE